MRYAHATKQSLDACVLHRSHIAQIWVLGSALLVTWPTMVFGAGPASTEVTTKRVDGLLELDPAGPWSLALEAGVGIGVLFATHGKINLSIGRTLWKRLEVEATLRFDVGERLLGLEGLAGFAMLFHVARHWTVLLRGQLGYAQFRQSLPQENIWTGALATVLAVEARFLITPRFELRLRPVAATGYWNQIWGLAIEPTVGMGYRF